MEARQLKLIDCSGRHGLPAPIWADKRPPEAPYGVAGMHGRSALEAHPGQPGSDIRVRLAHSAEEVGVVQVVGEGPLTGQVWKVASDERILLKTAGGDGGAGGQGEDGQAGGPGRDGRDATRYRNGGDGEDGAPGGNAGAGTSGANGGSAGHVFITVHEEDEDLLLPVEYDVHGGMGGKSGEHGEPGDGGVGGRGGDPHAWTERHTNSVSAHTRPGGSNGRNGAPGFRAEGHITGGQSGANGSVQIKVIRGDLSEATYPGPYALQVVRFDIIDENEDGINEPGEHLLVHNIVVRNVGGMPSPSLRSIKLLIQATQFLEPIATEPLELPRSIQPGQEVEVPGVLRALIRNEWAEKPDGTTLIYPENVSIVAYFDERLNRPLPGFSGATGIQIRYPLMLDAPVYLDCVAKGDKVRFKWTLHNMSTKAYGLGSLLGRLAATKLSDPERFFTLVHATAEHPDQAIDELPELAPNSSITIDQDFTVSDQTPEYNEGFLSLELLLSDPLTGAMRSVQRHRMQMQISGVYELSTPPSVLLVVNAKTPNHAIHQIIWLVRHRLHTRLDIFNLSLTGSYTSPVTGANVLRSYEGKSIIIAGNRFPYFSTGRDCDPWDLLDPWELGLLAKAGTNFLFAVVENLPGLQQWMRLATFPAPDLSHGAQSLAGELDSVVAGLKKTDHGHLGSDMAVHRAPVKKGLFGSVESSVTGATRKAAGALVKNLPLRRFAVVPDQAALDPAKQVGGMVVFEGMPRNANVVASVGEFPLSPPGTHLMADYHMFFVIACLPPHVRATMFWNSVGRTTDVGVSADVAYAGLDEVYRRPLVGDVAPVVDAKILSALTLSIQWTLSSELYRFTAPTPRFPDPLSLPEKLSQLPFLTQFLSLAPQPGSDTTPRITDATAASDIVTLLGTVHALANPLTTWQSLKAAFSFLGNRKAQLTPRANDMLFAALAAVCLPQILPAVKESVLKRSKEVKAGIIAGGGKNKRYDAGLGQKELAVFAGIGDSSGKAVVVDLADPGKKSAALSLAELQAHFQGWETQMKAAGDFQRVASAMLGEMVNPVEE